MWPLGKLFHTLVAGNTPNEPTDGVRLMNSHRVRFLPDDKSVQVETGTTLLAAAEKADVHLNTICGGEGLCGECRVRVTGGNAYADKHAIGFFTRDELEQGFVLACQTTVEDDLEIQVPAKSRIEAEKILTEGINLKYSRPEPVSLHRRPEDPATSFQPIVTKVYLELPEPTLADNTADIDRVIRELRQWRGEDRFEVSLSCLQDLAEKLRRYNWKVTATTARHGGLSRIMSIEGGDTTGRHYGLAVDVGTTTVVVQLIDMTNGEVLGVEGSHSLQARYGEDVISRMVFVCGRGSLDPVHQAVVDNINDLTKTLTERKGIDTGDITAIVAAGNTTMSHFLLNLTPCNIRLEPYVPTATVYPQVVARDIGIAVGPQAVLEVMPSVSSYVGGDIVAGVLASGMADTPEVKCLVDVGTNGEIVIGNNEWLVCCSASAGPAFEGGGSRSGMRAAKGAIQKVSISGGILSYETIGGRQAEGYLRFRSD